MASALRTVTVKKGVQRFGKGVKNARIVVIDTKRTVERFLQRSRNAMEDRVEQGVHYIRRKPVASVAMALTAGIVGGLVASRLRKD